MGVMVMTYYPIEPWLQLGIAGAGLFIVLVVVWLVFNSQNKNIDRLCNKIDLLISESAKDREELAKVLLASDKDQQQLQARIDKLFKYTADVHKRIVRIDTRLYDALNKGDEDETKN